MSWQWMAMLAITLAAWWLAIEPSQQPVVALVLLLAVGLKGMWLIDSFMGLRYCKPIWRYLIVGWLFFVLSFIGVFYFWSLS